MLCSHNSMDIKTYHSPIKSAGNFYRRRRNTILKSSYVLLLVLFFSGGTARHKTKSEENKPKKGLFSKLRSAWKNQKLWTLAKDISPGVLSSVPGFFALQIVLLIIRAILTLKVASLDGLLVSSLVSKKFQKFFRYLAFWMALGIPSSITNSLLSFSEHILSRNIRVNLTGNLLNQYLPDDGNSTLYKLINQSKAQAISTTRNADEVVVISDPNQRITTNIEQFSKSLASLPSQLMKPSLDLLLCANQLSSTGERTAEGVLMLGLITHVSSTLLRNFTPNFINLSHKSNDLENNFHMYHSRIISDNEEIALSRGHKRELDLLDLTYYELERFKRLEFRRLAIYDLAMNFVVKYVWGASGLVLCAIPIFSQFYATGNIGENVSANFITNRRLLLGASSSLGRLIQSKKNIQNLAGYTQKIVEFRDTLGNINEATEETTSEVQLPSHQSISGPNVAYANEITFDSIPLVTPTGTTLVPSLNFRITEGENLLIIGPNGCGKSSLFRILGGLWPVTNPGKLVIPPERGDLFYLPQRAYLTIGTLREQIIYPDSVADYEVKLKKQELAKVNGSKDVIVKNDEYFVQLLRLVQLDNLVTFCEEEIGKRVEMRLLSSESRKASSTETEYDEDFIPQSPLDLVRKWPDLLSIGEQQRLAIVRMYYHQPKFAVLDECTSSISPELEQFCYDYAINHLNVTVLSVCHRTSLWKFHSRILIFDGHGNAKFKVFDPEERLSKQGEFLEVEKELKVKEQMESKLNELKKFKKSRFGSDKQITFSAKMNRDNSSRNSSRS